MAAGNLKSFIAAPLEMLYRVSEPLLNSWRRIDAYAHLRSRLNLPLPASTVILGRAKVHGTGRVHFGEDLLLYPDIYLETQGAGEISIGNSVVISSGVHLVAYAGIRIGDGSMIGEYASVRDANHTRHGINLRYSEPVSRPIVIGEQVWIGRGAVVLSGVTIGDHATIGANAVVTRDVPAGALVAGVPAVPVVSRSRRPIE